LIDSESPIANNLRRVHERIKAACARADRSPNDVRLVAVTKYAQIDWVHQLIKLGVTELGESRPQQLAERVPLLPANITWHMIGHLQRNKARRVLEVATWIHSVDSLRLLTRIDALAQELEIRPKLLLEVNISGEEAKHGFRPDELLGSWKTVLQCPHVDIEGLMTMAPMSENIEAARPIFRELRELRNRLRDQSPETLTLQELSMGMSRDFEVAIEEKATIIRIGSELFKERE